MPCISCPIRHEVMPPRSVTHDKPVAFAFSDQNFTASLPSQSGDCLRIIRLENLSLLELADIAFELFEHTQPVVGTVFLFAT